VDNGPPSFQRKVASLWQMQNGKIPPGALNISGNAETQENQKASEDLAVQDFPEQNFNEQDEPDRELARLLANSVPDFSIVHEPEDVEPSIGRGAGTHPNGNPKLQTEKRVESDEIAHPGAQQDGDAVAHGTALQNVSERITWTSAAQARDFLEQVSQLQNRSPFRLFWKTRRGDFYLAIALILM